VPSWQKAHFSIKESYSPSQPAIGYRRYRVFLPPVDVVRRSISSGMMTYTPLPTCRISTVRTSSSEKESGRIVIGLTTDITAISGIYAASFGDTIANLRPDRRCNCQKLTKRERQLQERLGRNPNQATHHGCLIRRRNGNSWDLRTKSVIKSACGLLPFTIQSARQSLCQTPNR
jgi:hypothetical protein